MKKLYPLSFARDETTTLLKNSIETSAGIMSSTFAEAAIVYFFCPSLRCCYDVSKVGGAYAPAMERCIWRVSEEKVLSDMQNNSL